MKPKKVSIQKTQVDQLSFLEREALLAASLGDHTGVTAQPVGFLARNHYYSVGTSVAQAANSAPQKKLLEVSSGWKRSALQSKKLLAAKTA
jgi:hypothetical protein